MLKVPLKAVISFLQLDLHVSEAMHFALTADSVHTSHPLTVDVMTPNEINDIFDVITYSKVTTTSD